MNGRGVITDESTGRILSIVCCSGYSRSDYGRKRIQRACFILLLALAVLPACAAATRLKDIVSIEGVRENQLIGYGVVVGLNGTGDKRQTFFSAQTLTKILSEWEWL